MSKDDWEAVIDTTYEVVTEKRKTEAYEEILASTLGVLGLYNVRRIHVRTFFLHQTQTYISKTFQLSFITTAIVIAY